MTATDRRRRRRRASAAPAALLAGFLLAGCADATGIPGTDVFEVGAPARIKGEGGTMLLYLVDREGRLTPVLRPGPFPADSGSGPGSGSKQPLYDTPTGFVLRALLQGPNGAELAASLHTELPLAFVPVRDPERKDGLLTVTLPFPVTALSEAARGQIVCTVAHAEPLDVDARVVLAGQSNSIVPAQECPVPAG
ncbi:hypothetical protein EES41_28605 [Streptomyces sp. ADI95-16]|uniref:hypothetical protein n=1 Tax=Streptomyces sp. ADI95-16 TaxID=1522758 RepID=UPI000F3A88A1|nr:hypothetical protein [Streptomyces sp. ADI95-16]AYV30691.1 hypothetical protein EES41_28605 [Streptomyces sp. ADI95-16]